MKVPRWSVWLANLEPVTGSEQGRTRPVLIISETTLNDILPVVNALPITSRKKGRRVYPDEALLPANTAGLALESVALCYQIRTLDKQRIRNMFGVIDGTEIREAILEALRFQLAL